MIFAFYTDFRYSRPFYYDAESAKETDNEPYDASKTIISESRCYFKNRILLCWLDQNKETVKGTDYGEMPKEVLSFSDELLERFKE